MDFPGCAERDDFLPVYVEADTPPSFYLTGKIVDSDAYPRMCSVDIQAIFFTCPLLRSPGFIGLSL
ncbi:MAG: hypothetical protein O3B01_16160 [Planctomycetota bacterium]|nr:hypothetical protein [Planctomycetota bacterium]